MHREPRRGIPSWGHLIVALAFVAVSSATWPLFLWPYDEPMTATDWAVVVGHSLEVAGLYLTVAEVGYNRRNLNTGLVFVAVAMFFIGSVLTTVASITR